MSRGWCPVGSVADGDCGIDVMCIISGLPQLASSRLALRKQLADYILSNAEHAGVQQVFGCCQEMTDVAPAGEGEPLGELRANSGAITNHDDHGGEADGNDDGVEGGQIEP